VSVNRVLKRHGVLVLKDICCPVAELKVPTVFDQLEDHTGDEDQAEKAG